MINIVDQLFGETEEGNAELTKTDVRLRIARYGAIVAILVAIIAGVSQITKQEMVINQKLDYLSTQNSLHQYLIKREEFDDRSEKLLSTAISLQYTDANIINLSHHIGYMKNVSPKEYNKVMANLKKKKFELTLKSIRLNDIYKPILGDRVYRTLGKFNNWNDNHENLSSLNPQKTDNLLIKDIRSVQSALFIRRHKLKGPSL